MRAGNKAGSINNYIRHSRAALNKAVEWDYIKENPLQSVKEISAKKRLPKFMGKPSISSFLAKIESVELRKMVTAYIATGRRRSELLKLKWEDIDMENGRYLIRHSKSDFERSYPINALFRTVLASMDQSTARVFPLWKHPDTISHKVKAALVKAGYPNLTLHSMRHTYASIKAAEGKSLFEIQELLGHSDIKATQIYTHLTRGHLADISEINIGPVDLSGGKKS